jgi:tRNA threonylcarbamoyladenosine biosynthesis protein TsaB
MITLIIDTSTDRSFVAIAEGTKLLHCEILPQGHLSSRSLLSSIQNGMNHVGISIQAIDRVGVGIGPGAFTGMRVGVATAKGIVFSRQLPLLGFCSLSPFVPQTDGAFVSVIDARMGSAYVLFQEKKGDEIFQKCEPKLVSLNELKGNRLVGPSFQRMGIQGEEVDPNPTVLLKSLLKEEKRLNLLYLRNPYHT